MKSKPIFTPAFRKRNHFLKQEEVFQLNLIPLDGTYIQRMRIKSVSDSTVHCIKDEGKALQFSLTFPALLLKSELIWIQELLIKHQLTSPKETFQSILNRAEDGALVELVFCDYIGALQKFYANNAMYTKHYHTDIINSILKFKP